MEHISTEQLLAFIYNELSQTETNIVQQQIKENWGVKEEYDQLMSTIEELKGVHYSPSEQTVQNILAYASSSI